MTQVSTTRPAARARRLWSDLARTSRAHPVAATTVLAAVLQLVWWVLLANSGGDIAAQDAWAEFAHRHPLSAYNFAWYGGIHPVSYSVMSPYLMAFLGVRTTMILSAIVSAALIAFLLVRTTGRRRALLPALVGAVALFGNSISGRTTFVLGMAFGLAAVAALVAWPAAGRWSFAGGRSREAVAAVLALLATFGSPVDGLFLGLLAAALWLQRQRAAAYAIGVPPVLVVVLSKLFFPLSGVQPMHWPSAILPCLMAVFVYLTAPVEWRIARVASVVYVVGVLLCWLIPTPIGTNVTRLGLIFGGVVLTAVLVSGEARTPFPRRVSLGGWSRAVPVVLFAVLALVTSGTWQVATAVHDLVHTTPDRAWDVDTARVVAQLRDLGAQTTRIEVVPSASHREVSALSPPFVLARGWNRQVDAKLNERFYDRHDPMTHLEYQTWLRAWAVSYVVVPPGRPDNGSITENELISQGAPYLRLVWQDANWRVYRVLGASPTVSGGARVVRWDEAGMTVDVPRPGRYVIKEKYSRHMVLVDATGAPYASPDSMAANVDGCVHEELPPGSDDEPSDEKDLTTGWTVLQAPREGIYRLTSDYTHATDCPQE
ncbi:MFS transporter [Nocardioides sp. KR10-350]|uniref:MFS transporter n=1 Tax=Nocardioides cheoyonin TaxID=3156615 RepID=UPI0032B3601E